jgi:hypothetical protein
MTPWEPCSGVSSRPFEYRLSVDCGTYAVGVPNCVLGMYTHNCECK